MRYLHVIVSATLLAAGSAAFAGPASPDMTSGELEAINQAAVSHEWAAPQSSDLALDSVSRTSITPAFGQDGSRTSLALANVSATTDKFNGASPADVTDHGGTSSVPLPSAAPAGIMMLALIGAAGVARKMRHRAH